MRFAERASRKLARSTFYAMSRWQAKLEKKQAVLGRIVDIGAELYAISCAAVYARTLREEHPERGDEAIELADLFIRQARRRVDTLFGELFSNDDELAARLTAAGLATGDRLWRFPLSETYDKLIDSPIADMKNVGPRGAGSITAAQFIQRFVDDGVKWAHLDVAGMVWSDKAAATYDKGATGYGVKLLDRFVADHFER